MSELSFNSPNLDKIWDDLNRTMLEDLVPGNSPPLWGELEGIEFHRIRGLASYWNETNLIGYSHAMEDTISSLAGQNEDFYYLLISHNNKIEIFVGTGRRSTNPDLRGILLGAFPGIDIQSQVEVKMGQKLNSNGFLSFRGRLTGIPCTDMASINKSSEINSEIRPGTTNSNISSPHFPSLERLIRSMQGSSWGIFIHAIPFSKNILQNKLTNLLSTMNQVQALTRLQFQKLNQQMTKVNEEVQEGTTTSLSAEQANRHAEFILSRLELQLKRLRNAISQGAWNSDFHFFSPNEPTLVRLGAILRSVFHYDEEVVEPIRSFVCQGNGTSKPENFSTLITSKELSSFAYFPREESPGFQIRDFTLFDVDHDNNSNNDDSISLGKIIEHDKVTQLPYCIPLRNLSQHLLVSGITGSGKTTTIKHLVQQLSDHHPPIPFLIIEPAKSEYRSLTGSPIGTGTIQKLAIFTLGDETTSPFRLNPFQFEILDKDHFIHVQTHIDYLKSVFSNAFVLYPPMPYVLEICLHEIYSDRGWNLITNRNDRLPEFHWDNAFSWPLFPTFDDLYQKIDEVTERLGYDKEIKLNVRAGLQTRLESMMIGGKGIMLNTPTDKGIGELLKHPCVIELERIGDDELKVFLMGIILTRLYEYRLLENDKAGGNHHFHHLTVIEEAHRLLQRIDSDNNGNQTNIKAQAIETFANIMAEIRAFGEGILISDQVPAKLTKDALKNSATKVIHTIVAEDDRKALSEMTNMNSNQNRSLISLPLSRAAVFSPGDDHPVLVQICPTEGILKSKRPSDQEISTSNIKSGHNFSIHKDIQNNYQNEKIPYYIQKILQDSNFVSTWRASHLQFWIPELFRGGPLINLERYIKHIVGKYYSLIPAILNGCCSSISWFDAYNRGRMYEWDYPTINRYGSLRDELISILVTKDHLPTDYLTSLFEFYKNQTEMPFGPYPGCFACNNKCILRFDLDCLLKDEPLQNEWKLILQNETKVEDICTQWKEANRQGISMYLEDDNLPELREIQICIAANNLARIGLSNNSQRRMMEYFMSHL